MPSWGTLQTVDFLLSISNEITSIRDKRTLLNVLQYKLKEAFLFRDIALHLYPSDESEEIACLYTGVDMENMPELFEDDFTARVRNTTVPLIRDAGSSSIIGAPIRNNEAVIGELSLFTENKEAYTPEVLSLLQIVTNHISTAISNILAQEQIAESEQERAILLSLSNDLASVRNKNDLLQIIHRKIKKLFPIRNVSINLVNEDSISYSQYLVVTEDGLQPVDYENVITNSYPVNDGFFDKVLYGADPAIIDVETLVAVDNVPVFMKFMLETGIRKAVIVPLHTEKKQLGLFTLFFEKKINFRRRQLNLINGISYQLSIALANIFANEKLEQRNKEKAVMLSISNAIATVRNKEYLLDAINPFFAQLFPFSYDLIGNISADGNKFNIVTARAGTQADSLTSFQEGDVWQYSREYEPFREVMASAHPVVFDLDTLMEEKHNPDFIKWAYVKGAREMIIAAIRSKDKVWGYFIFFSQKKNKPDHNQLSIIQSITTQLTTALCNLLSAEKVEKQLIEIRTYKEKLEMENMYLQEEIGTVYNYNEIVGNSPEIQQVFQVIKQVSPSDSTVLILGETGTGKELIARAIHSSSGSKNKMMVKVNCATLPANLIESELFGHEKGSFTGATEQRIGKFELANNGILFLDEIGELPLELQSKLLRVLQEKEIERIGGKKTIRLNVRVIAATNRSLWDEVQQGKFRDDLYYRLNVFPVELPPLRSRKDDIPLLVNHFINRYSRKTGREMKQVTQKVMMQLLEYEWPGNIRELEHIIERSVIMNPGPVIKDLVLPSEIKKNGVHIALNGGEPEIKTIDEMERDYILSILKKSNGRIYGERGAAALLKIPPTTLNSKIKKLGIKRVHD
jgi:transcriptional regulator with GAF, ATPase, and Fis domain